MKLYSCYTWSEKGGYVNYWIDAYSPNQAALACFDRIKEEFGNTPWKILNITKLYD